jgi:hypothetical protein
MTPVTQTILHSENTRGNCLQAAVASLLDKPIEDVPHFITYGENWFVALILFMRDYGYEYKGTGSAEKIAEAKGIDGYVIAAGKSPRGVSHAVIYKGGEMVHDPHPSRAGVELTHFYQFEPFGDEREPLNWIFR